MSIPVIHARPLSDTRKGGHVAASACGLPNAWTQDSNRAICMECLIARGEKTQADLDEMNRMGDEMLAQLLAEGDVVPTGRPGILRVTRKGFKKLGL